MRERLLIATTLAAVAATACSSATMAATASQLPGQGKVVAGRVAVGSAGAGAMVLDVAGPAVIDWGKGTARGDINAGGVAGFNIGSAARVTFNGGTGAAVLNIDTSGHPSQIFGALNANGTNVFVANANGIIVGAKARIVSNRTVGLIGNRLLPSAATGFDGGAGSVAYGGGGGDVTVLPGASFDGGKVLIAGGGNVNVDLGAFGGPVDLRAGRASARAATDNAGASLTVTGRQRGAIAGFSSAGSATNLGTLSLAHAKVDGRFANRGALDLANGFALTGKLVNEKTLRTHGDVIVGSLNNKGRLTTGGVLTVRGWVLNTGRISSPTNAGALSAIGSLANRGRIEGVSHLLVSRGDLVNSGFISLVDSGDVDGTPGTVAVRGGNLVNTGSIGGMLDAHGRPLANDLSAEVVNGDVRNRGLLAGFSTITTSGDARVPNFQDGGDYSIVNAGTLRGSFNIDANATARPQDNHSTGSFTNAGVLDVRAAHPGADRSLWARAWNDLDLGGTVLLGGRALGPANALDGVLVSAAQGKLTIGAPLVFFADGSNGGNAYLSGKQVTVAANVIGMGPESAIYLSADRRSDGSYAYIVQPGVKLEAGDVHIEPRF